MQHQLIPNDTGFTCKRCRWQWKTSRVSSDCPGLPRYGWDSRPANLLTKTELGKKGLKPPQRPVGVMISASHPRDRYWLYDEAQATPKRKATPAQLEALKKAQLALRTCRRCGKVQPFRNYLNEHRICDACEWDEIAEQNAAEEDGWRADRRDAIEWAKALLAADDWVILDFETTDLPGLPLSVAVMNPAGEVVYQSLVNPEQPISPDAMRIHGITNEQVAGAPTWPTVYQALEPHLQGKRIVAYNAAFDRGVYAAANHRYGLQAPAWKGWECAMVVFAQFYGEWSD